MQNFVSAATGIAVRRRADPRLRAPRQRETIGNFWVDLTRVTALRAAAAVAACSRSFLVGQGVVQNFAPYQEVTTLDATAYQQPKNGADGQP